MGNFSFVDGLTIVWVATICWQIIFPDQNSFDNDKHFVKQMNVTTTILLYKTFVFWRKDEERIEKSRFDQFGGVESLETLGAHNAGNLPDSSKTSNQDTVTAHPEIK